MAAWTAGVLLALGLAWFVCDVIGGYRHARARWIAKTMDQLAEIRRTPPTEFKNPERALPTGGWQLRVRRGAVRVGEKGWVYIITHSMHHDGLLSPTIGDLSLAVDNDGNYYFCDDHVCGGVEMKSGKGSGFADIGEFINAPNFPVGNNKWQRLAPGQLPPPPGGIRGEELPK
jgi:hypothetical protein